MRPALVFSLLLGLGGFFLFATYEALYLERGYALGLSLTSRLDPLFQFPIQFPLWRRLAQAVIALGYGGAVVLLMVRDRAAGRLATLCLGAMIAVAAWDVWAYGRLAAPTSIWSILLGLLLTLLIAGRPAPKRRRVKPWEV